MAEAKYARFSVRRPAAVDDQPPFFPDALQFSLALLPGQGADLIDPLRVPLGLTLFCGFASTEQAYRREREQWTSEPGL